LDKQGQKGKGMPKRSHLGWRTRLFPCLHFALSFVGIWLQPLVVRKQAMCGLERYKGFLIDGSAVPTFATGFDWHSQGIILRPGRLSFTVEVKSINGTIFTSKGG
jgi:hypothetical protein